MPQETHRLRRDGAPDLKFTGELIGEASNHSHQGPHQNRWTEVAVYRTTGGRYVAAVSHLTQWQGEHDTHAVSVGSSPVGLLQELRDASLVEGRGGDVVDLVKEALEAGGVDAAEELEEGATDQSEAREDGAILYVVAVIHEGDVTPHVSAGTDPGDLLDELRDLGEKPAIVESLRRVLSAHVDPDVWAEAREEDDDEGGTS